MEKELKKYNLFLDDQRYPADVYGYTGDSDYNDPAVNWAIVRSYDEFVNYIKLMFELDHFPKLVSWDHDLGLEHIKYYFENGGHENPPDPSVANFTEKTGFDATKWLVDFCIENKLKFPKYKVHSKNPVGKENIIKYIENAKTHTEI